MPRRINGFIVVNFYEIEGNVNLTVSSVLRIGEVFIYGLDP